MSNRPLMKNAEAADYLRVSTATLAHWRRHGKGPRWGRVGHGIVYRVEDLDEFIEEGYGGRTSAAS